MIKIETIVRTTVLVLALINQCCEMLGYKVIPITDDQIADLVTLLFTVASSLWAWWKNNSFTAKAIKADEYKKSL